MKQEEEGSPETLRRQYEEAIQKTKFLEETVRENETLKASLQKAEIRISQIIENSPDAIVILDISTGKFQSVNQRAVDIFGFTKEEFQQIGPVDISPPQQEDGRTSFEAATAYIQRAIQGELVTFEWLHRAKSGEIIPCEVRLIALLGENILIRGSILDFRDQKKIKDELKENQKRLESAIYGAELGLWEWDVETNGNKYNNYWAEMLGYKLEDLKPHVSTWQSLLHPDDLPHVDAALQNYIAGKSPVYEAEFRMKCSDGSWKWIFTAGKFTDFDSNGKPLKMYGIHADIDRRKKAEQELKEKEAALSRSQKLSGLGSWEYDRSTAKIAFSEQLGKIYERPNGIEDGIKELEFVHPEDRGRVRHYFEEAIKNKYIREIEYRIVTPTGKTKTVLNQSELILDEKGEVVKIIGSVLDVSEKRKNERLLQFRLGFETITTAISRAIINLPLSSISLTIHSGLEKLGMFLNMQRVNIVFYNETYTTRKVVYEWIDPNAAIQTSNLNQVESIDPHSFFTAEMRVGRIAKIAKVEDLPVEAFSDRQLLTNNGIQSFTAVPLLIGGVLKGRLGFGSEKVGSILEAELDILENQLLRNFAEIVINALERKRVEEELTQERDLLSSITENSATSIVVLNPQGKILYANKSSEHVLGIELTDITSRSYNSKQWEAKSVDGGEWKEEDQPFTVVMRTGKPVYDIRHSIVTSDKQIKYLSVNGSPVKNQEGEIISLVFLVTDITENVLNERELRESEDRLRLALNAANMGSWSWDIREDRITWSEKAFQIFRIRSESFGGNLRSIMDLVHPEDRPSLDKLMREVLAGERGAEGDDIYFQHRVLFGDGEIAWVEAKAKLFRDKHSNPIRVVGTVTDITERKRAEEELKASELRFQTFYQFSNEAILLVERGKIRISDSNLAFQKLFGYTAEEAIGLNVARLLSKESLEDLLSKKFLIGSKDSMEVVAKKKNGNLFPAIISQRVFVSKGSTYYSINIIDTTPFKEAEELRIINDEIRVRNRLIEIQKTELENTLDNLKKTQSQLIQSEKMAALGQLMAGIAHEINNPIGAVQASNQNIQECLNRFRSLLPGVQIAMGTLNSEMRELSAEFIESAIQSNEHYTGMEQRNRKKAITSVLESKKIPTRLAVSYADTLVDMGIGELNEKFIPLLLLDQSELILEYSSLESYFFRNTKTVQVAVDRISKILYALKNFSHFDIAGERILASVKDTIETVLTIYHNQLKKGVDLQKDFEDVPPILCYPDDLLHIWTNLIYNSLQAMQFKGAISIRLKRIDGELMVDVKDNGPGIPQEIQEKIFEPFFTTKAPGEGSGLGLDIVKKIVQKHEGRIELESVPGNTSFRIYLPIENESIS
ncbi:PAS domain S-box protein [Leptospira yasudae]|uniref:PAS domain S-box protein n=1 Tax=Leptospira yasudae TaxID=2202201 RepID=UPI001C4E45FC|nr:PAS domain S-box protein [Leptospira yasudae]MBW0435805.1 PAS domain S-box protein [Leptospira yasudae]